MAEVAGLVLGGIPLAIWALERYAEPFEAFNDYRNSIETFRTMLVLQNRQLQTTLSHVGLSSDPSTHELRECLETKFPAIHSDLMFIIQRMDAVTTTLLKDLNVDTNAGMKPGSTQEKIKWEWRRVKHSFTTKKRKKVIEDLREWNESLRRCLEKPEIPAEDDSRKVDSLRRQFNNQRCSSIRQRLFSLHRALESGFSCDCLTPHRAAVHLDWAASESNAAKSLEISLSSGAESWRTLCFAFDDPTSKPNPLPVPDICQPALRPPVQISSSTSLRARAAVRFLRSLSTTPPQQSVPPPATSSSALPFVPGNDSPLPLADMPSPVGSNDIANLCAEVFGDQRAPETSLRFVKDPEDDEAPRFRLGYSRQQSSKPVKALPLKALISADSPPEQNHYISLSSKERYGIAAAVAWGILHLSGGPWLNAGHWDSDKASMFVEQDLNSGREFLSRYPYATTTFSSPVPDQNTNLVDTGDDFRHLVPNPSVFALGLLLIDLCINKPASPQHPDTSRGDNVSLTTLLDDYQSALKDLDEVYRVAGDSYGYAAERCVKFSFQGRDQYKDFDFSQFRQQFYDAVVAPVQATCLMFPDSRDVR